jgi:hypothetical protein
MVPGGAAAAIAAACKARSDLLASPKRQEPPGARMSLYYVQKLLYQLNRDAELRRRFAADDQSVLAAYELTAEEREAIRQADIGLLYVLGVNGQLLMHYAALRGLEWSAYLEAMRDGVRRHGPVRAGVYAMVQD